MKFSFAVALTVLACAAYIEASGSAFGFESIYNRNTNLNRNKNKDKAAVWSSIFDALFSSQFSLQQQAQLQQCLSSKTCGPALFAFIEQDSDDDQEDGPKGEAEDGDDGDKGCFGRIGCHGGALARARIYNVNTNKNYNKNKVAADVHSKIRDFLSSSQTDIQQQLQIQEQKCPKGYKYVNGYGCMGTHDP